MALITYLQQKPMVGAASGFGGGLIPFLVHMLTDDFIIKVVSGAAAWAGLMVAILTIAIRCHYFIKKLFNHKT